MTRAKDLGLTPVDHPEHWERYYAAVSAPADMPWYCAGLDPDVERALVSLSLPAGRALDLGTGPANQAFELARRGFDVTGTDLSPSAIERARARAREEGAALRFEVDDILATALAGPFDLILDRGCFHCLFPQRRDGYAATIHRLLAPGGTFLLKTFSHAEPGTEGPHRFRPEDLDAIFGAHLARRLLVHTTYQGTLDEQAQALFSAWSRAG
jgi:SAM-dependent methyltransferase